MSKVWDKQHDMKGVTIKDNFIKIQPPCIEVLVMKKRMKFVISHITEGCAMYSNWTIWRY